MGSPPQVNRMLGFALNTKRLRERLMDSSTLVSEVNVEYARSMNKIIFDEAMRRGSSGCAAPLVQLNETFPQWQPSRPVPARGTVNACEAPGQTHDFAQQFSEFSFRTLHTKPEVIAALGKVRRVQGQCRTGWAYQFRVQGRRSLSGSGRGCRTSRSKCKGSIANAEVKDSCFPGQGLLLPRFMG